ncbi:MAG: transglycosylase SLT domain-containing protein [Chloroflexi bacterium]|jgi:soluble lytic murein transglycosylase|nr:transglycosylase SLT domain-containing protein [Chloroflexota bacterium]MBT4305802.1 transglycosylase SLT domain-containing protein [Chloroflexota bacterium]MBT4533626.1 transglycosylase SLT domain-containing protein [Chloroflexota bacterium]MBT4681731.1 transglycosylase SLT domain-containing protein [Chloroflexota bacterium]MBT4756516.1 transglycosylase SLT domain-containing protein [Chloroflexota bacterium]
MRSNKKFLALLLITIFLSACNLNNYIAEEQAPTQISVTSQTPNIVNSLPTPISTSTPKTRILQGDLALFYGDWEKAINQYSSAYENNQDSEIKMAALLGLGRTYFQSGESDLAIIALNSAKDLNINSPLQPHIFFTLGQVYEQIEEDENAINAYSKYLELQPGIIDGFVYEKIGDIQFSIKNFQAAIDNYVLSLQSPSLSDKLLINIKVGDSYEALGDIATSLVTYEDVYERTGNEFIKAQMQYYIGYANIALGNPGPGYIAYQSAVNDYPTAYFSLLALTELLENEVPVSEYTQAFIYYSAGQYELAGKLFNSYLNSTPDHDDQAHYYYGLTLQKTSQYAAAIQQFNEILLEHEDQTHYADAVDEISYMQWFYLEDYESAIETIETFVNSNEFHPQTPELLFFAGRIAERYNDLQKAASLWEDLGLGYSNSDYAYEGLFQAGIAKYRLEEYQSAVDYFFSSLGLVDEAEEQAKSYFWIGKSYDALNSPGNAQNAWIQSIETDPTGYYSERSAEMIDGLPSFLPQNNSNLSIDLEAERKDAEVWLRLVFALPTDTDINDLSILSSDHRFIRGTEFWQLGLYTESRIEFESLRNAYSSDALNSYRLANYLIDLGLYRPGIFAARNVLNLAGLDDAGTFEAPIYFNRLRFGLYFSELVLPTAETYSIDPLLLFSIMRQESLFEGFVTSSAGARGLMQIMPATGDTIFNFSGWPTNYTGQDLYRPLVSVNFGARYLSTYRDTYNGSIPVALASYNAGPGNAAAWINYADGDPDLYLEVIRFAETRNYLRGISEQYTIYKNLYQSTP